MIKKPNIVNMTLTSTKPSKSFQIQNDASINSSVYPHSLSDDTIIKDVMQFVQLITTEKNKIKAKEQRSVKAMKQGKRSPKKALKQQFFSMPMDLSLSVQTVLRKFLLYKVEQKQETIRNGTSKGRLFRQKNINTRSPFYKINKENTEVSQIQQIEEDVFRSIAVKQSQKEKNHSKICNLQAQNDFLKQLVEEKNHTISKLLAKQAQMKKKYNDQITRIARTKNIFNISSCFDKQQSQGKFLMSITGRHVKEEENSQKESIVVPGGEIRVLPRSGSDYLKGNRSSGLVDIKKHTLKSYKKNFIEPAPIQNINTTLAAEQGDSNQLEFSIKQLKNHNQQSINKILPNYFQGFTDSPKNLEQQNIFQNYSKKNVETIKDMNQQEFQALQQKGFYVQTTQKGLGSII